MNYLLSLVLICCLTGCAAPQSAPPPQPPEEAALTVNGREVPLWACRYWLGRACEQAEVRCRQAGQTPDWETGGPDALREEVRDRAIADAALFAAVDARAQAWELSLGDDDRAELERLWQARLEAHGGEKAYLAALANRGLTGAQARTLAETGLRYRKLHRAAPEHVSEEALAAFAEAQGLLTVDRIDVSGEEARSRIEGLFARLNAAPDPAAAFPALAAAGEDTQGPRTVKSGDGALSPALEDAARALKPGQHSGILEDGAGFAILLRLPPDRAVLIPQWLDFQLLNDAKTAEITALPALSALSIPPENSGIPGVFP